MSSSVIGSADIAPRRFTACCICAGRGDSASSPSSGESGVALDSRACSCGGQSCKVVVFLSLISFLSLTYPFQLLEVLSEEGHRIVRSGHTELHDAVLQDLLYLVPLDVVLALLKALLLRADAGGGRRGGGGGGGGGGGRWGRGRREGIHDEGEEGGGGGGGQGNAGALALGWRWRIKTGAANRGRQEKMGRQTSPPRRGRICQESTSTCTQFHKALLKPQQVAQHNSGLLSFLLSLSHSQPALLCSAFFLSLSLSLFAPQSSPSLPLPSFAVPLPPLRGRGQKVAVPMRPAHSARNGLDRDPKGQDIQNFPSRECGCHRHLGPLTC